MLRVALAWGVCVALALGAPGMAAAGNLIVNGGFEHTKTGTLNGYIFNSFFGNGDNVTGWYSQYSLSVWFANAASAQSPVGGNTPTGLWGPLNGTPNELTDSPQGGAFITIDDASFNNPIHRGVNETVAGDNYMQSLYWAVSQQHVYEDSTLQSVAAPVHDQSVRDIKVQSQ